ncbi:MAG: RsbRD N-terminal domain-containing protein [Desulfobulbaceae bacterium]|nr:RsbRD N-terminal domain-containing protein [Desulfobulbaceae bacterium]HIJ89488.1 RsbRD N-terminal domain-containing protein [Deltaproteobacteria bacterium]
MLLAELLIDRKGEILDSWADQVLATYPPDAAMIFKKGKNQFANPVGCAVKNTLWTVYALLFEKNTTEGIVDSLEQMVLIRAVQTFIPSEAVSMAYILKGVVKDFCRQEKVADLEGWHVFEEKVDILAYTLFDLYAACRERLYQTRLAELKSGNHIITDGGCPSKLMDGNTARKAELKPIVV